MTKFNPGIYFLKALLLLQKKSGVEPALRARQSNQQTFFVSILYCWCRAGHPNIRIGKVVDSERSRDSHRLGGGTQAGLRRSRWELLPTLMLVAHCLLLACCSRAWVKVWAGGDHLEWATVSEFACLGGTVCPNPQIIYVNLNTFVDSLTVKGAESNELRYKNGIFNSLSNPPPHFFYYFCDLLHLSYWHN